MSANTSVLSLLGRDVWNAEAYGSLSVASDILARSAGGSDPSAQAGIVWWNIRTLNGHLGKMFRELRDMMDGKVASPPPTDNITLDERITRTKLTLQELDEALVRVYQHAGEVGLAKLPLLNRQYSKLREHIDEVQDLREWFDMFTNPGPVNELFKRAEREAEHEQPIDLSKVW